MKSCRFVYLIIYLYRLQLSRALVVCCFALLFSFFVLVCKVLLRQFSKFFSESGSPQVPIPLLQIHTAHSSNVVLTIKQTFVAQVTVKTIISPKKRDLLDLKQNKCPTQKKCINTQSEIGQVDFTSKIFYRNIIIIYYYLLFLTFNFAYKQMMLCSVKMFINFVSVLIITFQTLQNSYGEKSQEYLIFIISKLLFIHTVH